MFSFLLLCQLIRKLGADHIYQFWKSGLPPLFFGFNVTGRVSLSNRLTDQSRGICIWLWYIFINPGPTKLRHVEITF
jgi:hypothetical protein